MTKNTRLVYTTDRGPVTPGREPGRPPAGDGIVRIRRETSGRKGKGVTTISGLALEDKALRQLAKELKQLCGTGGTVKDFVIEIQGDHRDKLRDALAGRGYNVKLAGG